MSEPRDPLYTPLLERLKVNAAGSATLPPVSKPVAAGPAPAAPTRSSSEPAPMVDRNAAMASLGISTHVDDTRHPWFGAGSQGEFVPLEPETLDQAMLRESDVAALVLKSLLTRGFAQGREIAAQLRLPFRIVQETLRQLRQDQWVVYKASAQVDDFIYELTSQGREQARRIYEQCSYCGAAPVSLEHYTVGVTAQSITKHRPGIPELQRAFSDLLLNRLVIEQLAQATHACQGLFLYGAPGNGKSSIATRITRAFGQPIWIPRAIGVEGEIIRLFDPCVHEELPLPEGAGMVDSGRIDARWVRIQRPTVVVGGELTMDRLEVTVNPATGTCEASLQMKSNGGTLLIDDFGRQRVSVRDLLNRWIVPLEKRIDFLNLQSGRSIQVPFEQLIVFSTNLEPRDLVDEAFLRRIPYKIELGDPTEADFRELFRRSASSLGVMYSDRAVDYLLERYYRANNRPLRCCHPRDLVLQASHFCQVRRLPPTLSIEAIDAAINNYFSVSDRNGVGMEHSESSAVRSPIGTRPVGT